jgi:hypothetical protein
MTGTPLGKAPQKPAKGVVRGKPDIRRIVVQFDAETFDEISAKAQQEDCSFAEIVRRGVEWMLMEEATP